VIAGTDTERAVTPFGLEAWSVANPATEADRGLIELATNAEVIFGTDTERAVTPAGLKAWSIANPATEAERGLIELATDAEAVANPEDLAPCAITPRTLGRYSGLLPAMTEVDEDDVLIMRDVSQNRDVALTMKELRVALMKEIGTVMSNQMGDTEITGSTSQTIFSSSDNLNGCRIAVANVWVAQSGYGKILSDGFPVCVAHSGGGAAASSITDLTIPAGRGLTVEVALWARWSISYEML
ncbi:hypothetical protein, partial [Rhodospirillum sp. A1_3_36]|uniref:hypothetical protein n=1 Tax=Rhodospirillum sp. A1_3_36 TaxID=3391666 RepID=UPI0039A5DF29